jgi:hypothetical protein
MDMVEANCPPAVIEHVQKVDLTSSENSSLFSWIASQCDLMCQVSTLPAVASRVNGDSHLEVVDDFCSSVATYARFLDEDIRSAIADAYLRMTYDPAIAMNYFAGLRYNAIDIRTHLRGRIKEDWSFVHPRLEAETWHYYLYLASLGEPGAYEALAKKLAATANGNDVTNLINSLADLKSQEVRQILLQYSQDDRRADGPEGPELTIAETVAIILSTGFD